MTAPTTNSALAQAGAADDLASVALLAVYFGPLPSYTTLFVQSCGANPTIDVHVVADQAPPLPLPPNVIWHRSTLAEVSTRAQETLGSDLDVATPYKLNDFKPAYGVLFEDLLAPYDFWGWCDIDVVWGNLRAFLTPDLLGEVDVYSVVGEDYLCGGFTLFRNAPLTNRLFERAPGYKALLKADGYQGFDEMCHRWDEGRRPVEELESRGLPVSFSDTVWQAEADGVICLRTPYATAEPSLWWDPGFVVRWDGERLYNARSRSAHDQGREILMCHFLHNKKQPFFTFPRWDTFPEQFSITWAGLDRLAPEQRVRRLGMQASRAVRSGPDVLKRAFRKAAARLRP